MGVGADAEIAGAELNFGLVLEPPFFLFPLQFDGSTI